VVSSGFANSYALTSVMARGNQWEAIFLDDQNREKMLEVLGEACGRTGFLLR